MRCVLQVLSLCLGLAAAAPAQSIPFPLTFYIHDTTGQTADTPLPAIYQFASAPVGGNSHVVLKAINSSTSTIFLVTAFAAVSNGSLQQNPNFSVTGLFNDLTMAPGASVLFTVNFSPTATGITPGYLEAEYQVQQGSCSFTSTNPATQCPSGMGLAATLNATGTPPQLVLSYASASGSVTLQPSSASPLNFGNVSLSASASITFTLTNQSTVAIASPAVAVPPPTTFSSNPFSLSTTQVPASIAAGSSASFVVTFSPGQTGVVTTSLTVGSNSYPLQGAGIVVADIDALQISYVDSNGVRGLPQAATPISFGQIVAGTTTTTSLAFTVTNPTTSFNAVSIPSFTVAGANFQISALAGVTSFPASLAPGSSITFTITFAPSAAGTYAGSLSLGSRVFVLSGTSINSPLPSFSFQVSPSVLGSQEQATVSVQFSAPSTLSLVGVLTLTFVPSLTNVTDDPAVMFMANSSRQISVSIAAGQQLATYNGQSALVFQTGTTAGTITFSLAFPNTPIYKQSYTITPAIPQISTATAVRSDPNLIVTVTGYDNTYSLGQLNFTFYGTNGNVITPIQVNAASSFQQLFFNNNTAGGAFSLQATFPVTGSVASIGSVTVALANSTGQASSTQNFQ